jgi:hypothetical protein
VVLLGCRDGDGSRRWAGEREGATAACSEVEEGR